MQWLKQNNSRDATDSSVVRHQNRHDGGPNYSEVSGSEQESSETYLWSTRESVLFSFENTLVERQRAGCKKSDSREAVQSRHHGHMDRLGTCYQKKYHNDVLMRIRRYYSRLSCSIIIYVNRLTLVCTKCLLACTVEPIKNLLQNLTGGIHGGLYITDVTNASRTMLMNIETLGWDLTLCRYFDIPMQMLPEIRSSSEIYGKISISPLSGIPISGVSEISWRKCRK